MDHRAYLKTKKENTIHQYKELFEMMQEQKAAKDLIYKCVFWCLAAEGKDILQNFAHRNSSFSLAPRFFFIQISTWPGSSQATLN